MISLSISLHGRDGKLRLACVGAYLCQYLRCINKLAVTRSSVCIKFAYSCLRLGSIIYFGIKIDYFLSWDFQCSILNKFLKILDIRKGKNEYTVS